MTRAAGSGRSACTACLRAGPAASFSALSPRFGSWTAFGVVFGTLGAEPAHGSTASLFGPVGGRGVAGAPDVDGRSGAFGACGGVSAVTHGSTASDLGGWFGNGDGSSAAPVRATS